MVSVIIVPSMAKSDENQTLFSNKEQVNSGCVGSKFEVKLFQIEVKIPVFMCEKLKKFDDLIRLYSTSY